MIKITRLYSSLLILNVFILVARLDAAEIAHNPVLSADAGSPIQVTAHIHEPKGVKNVRAYFKLASDGKEAFKNHFVVLERVTNTDIYRGYLPGAAAGTAGVDYTILVRNDDLEITKSEVFNVEILLSDMTDTTAKVDNGFLQVYSELPADDSEIDGFVGDFIISFDETSLLDETAQQNVANRTSGSVNSSSSAAGGASPAGIGAAGTGAASTAGIGIGTLAAGTAAIAGGAALASSGGGGGGSAVASDTEDRVREDQFDFDQANSEDPSTWQVLVSPSGWRRGDTVAISANTGDSNSEFRYAHRVGAFDGSLSETFGGQSSGNYLTLSTNNSGTWTDYQTIPSSDDPLDEVRLHIFVFNPDITNEGVGFEFLEGENSPSSEQRFLWPY